MLVRMMEDTEVPFGVRAKIAQDLLDRAGLIATQVHQIIPMTEDPARSCAAPGVTEPEATQSPSEKLRWAGTRSEMQVPGDARVPSTAWTRLPSASLASTKGTASSKPAI